jgi:hypothetical protein
VRVKSAAQRVRVRAHSAQQQRVGGAKKEGARRTLFALVADNITASNSLRLLCVHRANQAA